MKKLFLPCIFLASAAFIPVPPSAKTSHIDHPAFSHSHNQFAFRLMQATLEEDPANNNKLVSPVSLYFALSILYNGAGHAPQDSIGELLQATGIGALNLGGMCKELLLQLPGEDQQVEMSLANSVWINRAHTTLQPAFTTLAENLYYAPVQPLSFGNNAATAKINNWVDQNSFHRIPRLIQQTSSRDWMYLINMLYFKSDWQQPFELYNTHPAPFFLPDGNAPQIPFMNRRGGFNTFSDTGFTMIELPYGAGKGYSMYVIMPEDVRRPINSFTAGFSADRLDYALSHMTPQYVELFLPRWDCTYTLDRSTQVLDRLGMGIAFNPKEADFSNMFKVQPRNVGGGYLSRVMQTSVISVNERGTEAVAATDASPALGTVIAPRPPREIRADHPFMYMIIEKQQHIVLFTGIVNDPTPPVIAPATPSKPAVRHRRRR